LVKKKKKNNNNPRGASLRRTPRQPPCPVASPFAPLRRMALCWPRPSSKASWQATWSPNFASQLSWDSWLGPAQGYMLLRTTLSPTLKRQSGTISVHWEKVRT